MQEQLDAIKLNIKDGQLPKALKELAKLPAQVIRPFEKDILNLQGRLKIAYKKNQSQLVTAEEHKVEVNKIREKCTSLVFEIQSHYNKKKNVQQEGNWNLWLLGTVILFFVGLGIYQNWPQDGAKTEAIRQNTTPYQVHATPGLDSIFDVLIYPFSNVINEGEPGTIGDIHKLLATKLREEENINIVLVDTINPNLTADVAAKIGEEQKMNLVLWGQKSYLKKSPDSVFLSIQHEIIGKRNFGSKMQQLYGGTTNAQAYNSRDLLTSQALTLPVKDVLKWLLANKAFTAHKWAVAAQSFESILEDPWYNIGKEDQIFLLLKAAGAYAHDGQFSRAKKLHQQVLALEPNNSRAFLQLGMTYNLEQKPDSAIYFISEAIRLEPTFHASYNNRAGIYKQKKEYLDAIEDFSQAVQLDSNFFFGYGNRASVHDLQGDHTQALMDYDQAIKIASKSKENNYIVSIYHCNKASIYLNLAQEQKGRYTASHSQAGQGITKTGVYLQEARAELDIAESVERNEVTSLVSGLHALQSGNLLQALGHFEATETIYRFKNVKPFNLAQSYNGRAQVYFIQENYKGAVTTASKAIEISPNTPHFYQTRSNSYAKLGLHDEAAEDKRTYIRLRSAQLMN